MKAQLELLVVTTVKDNAKCFYKYTNNNERAKENLHSLLDTEGNVVAKDEERLRYLMPSLLSLQQ